MKVLPTGKEYYRYKTSTHIFIQNLFFIIEKKNTCDYQALQYFFLVMPQYLLHHRTFPATYLTNHFDEKYFFYIACAYAIGTILFLFGFVIFYCIDPLNGYDFIGCS